MTTVRSLLKVKGNEVWCVPAAATLRETLKVLAEKNIGAVMVQEAGKIVGIFSERDYARHAARRGTLLLDEPVSDFMTRSVFYINPDQTVDECMALMTSKHIRHIPVLEDDHQLVGLISIGDVVKQLMEEKETTIHGLENYILGHDYSG
ncbi:MAG: CBS domain-containing protein [Chloroflexota bacterium]|jgi:CBS domain-containing protein